jgi:hypothetical protein
VCYEGIPKSAPGVRAPLEASFNQMVKSFVAAFGKAFTADECARVIARVVKLQMLDLDEEQGLLGCGAANLITCWARVYPKAFMECDTAALFGGAVTLLRRVCPSPLPAEWWVGMCAEVDVTSVQLGLSLELVQNSRQLDQAVLDSATWLGPAVTEAVHICKVNASVGLSARPTMSFWAVTYALRLVEAGAKVELHAASLLDSGVIEALDYACLNDFAFIGLSVSTAAAGTLLALLGRNEGGRTLSRSTVHAVVDSFAIYFEPSDFRYQYPIVKFLPEAGRVATMAISDANKKIMLQHDKLLDTLVSGLLLDDDNPRQAGKEGASMEVQEASAEVLARLALFGPGAEALRSHDGVMRALRLLRDGVSSTEKSRESVVQALFQLEERKQVQASAGVSAKHVMMSYNWDHQPVIKRIHAALVQRGYSMWIDVEQMKGSTVDAMSKAVEDSAVVLFGASRQYKESTNCRLEAQYAMQREVDTVPLMLVDGYRPDGWLGMLIGTRMWYGFYGSTVTDEVLFQGKIEELCRELGDRGRIASLVPVDVSRPPTGRQSSAESGGDRAGVSAAGPELRAELGLP